ncbi:MAG: MmcQ/YjbR family DNA-binding protein [Eubacteriales bacterium]|nr:MmcQ/YjbR family DNA-binding protein [Eubacteriales bacterium]
MKERKEVLDFGMTFPDVYVDAPFHDDNWVLLRYRKNKKAFAWTYERNGHMWVNVKVDPQWRDLWRNTYPSVLPGYHQNKEHWNSIILDGTVPDGEIKRMIAESYDLIAGKNKINAKAKANASQGIPGMLEIAVGKHFRENSGEKHLRNAANGWYRYDSRFALPVYDESGEVEQYNVFHASMLIHHANDGKMYLYDVLDIKKETSNPFKS